MATKAEFEALMQQRIDEGDIQKANRIRVEKLGLPPISRDLPVNNDPQLQVDSGMQEFGNIMSSLPGHINNLAAESASAFNRSVAQGMDFLGPGTVNAGLRLAGQDYQLPTFEGGFNTLPGSQGGFMSPGITRAVVRGASGAAPAALGFAPVAGRNIASPAGALFEMLGLGTAKPAAGIAPLAVGGYPQLPPPTTAGLPANTNSMYPSLGRNGNLKQLIEDGSGDMSRAGKALDPYTGRVINDAAAQSSLKQGVPKDIISMVQAASTKTKAKLSLILRTAKNAKNNRVVSLLDRPTDTVGQSIMDRYHIIREANKRAGKEIDVVVNKIGDEIVDPEVVRPFFEDLKSMGVTADGGELNFVGSDIEGLDGPIKAIQRMITRMSSVDNPTVMDVHKIKRYIDEVVSYGRGAEGLSGKADRALKGLRRSLNQAIQERFPEYARVNKEYSETIDVMDKLQGVAGKKIDLLAPGAEKAVGTLSRRVAGNPVSRVPLINTINDMQDLARKYTTPAGTDVAPYVGPVRSGVLADAVPDVTDDIMTQIAFADEMDTLGTQATASLQGDVGKVMDGIANTESSPSMTGLLVGGSKSLYRKARGINDDGYIRALEELLSGSK